MCVGGVTVRDLLSKKKKPMTNYPEWLSAQRPQYIKGDLRKFDPSEKRMEDRQKIFDVIMSKSTSLAKIDAIIDHFRTKYEGEKWTGLGKKAKQELFLQWKGRCMWCKEKITLSESTIEHIKPRAEGGTDDWENLGIAHQKCNGGRENVLIPATGYYNDTQSTVQS